MTENAQGIDMDHVMKQCSDMARKWERDGDREFAAECRQDRWGRLDREIKWAKEDGWQRRD